MSDIAFAGVRRVFTRDGKDFLTLDGIDLTLPEKEFVAIVGPSGCGKTTCMRMVAGLEFPSTGTVKVGGEVVTAPGGSRLPIEENIKATREVVELVRAFDVPVEAELGAVLGHEAGPLPPYEELYASGKGFTDVREAGRFVRETECDWLSVAIGNIHGAIAAGRKDQKKVEARLNLNRLEQLHSSTCIPLVLHGASGIKQENVREAMKRGIAKINVATEIRQPYERELRRYSIPPEGGSVSKAQAAVYERTRWVLENYLGVSGMRKDAVPYLIKILEKRDLFGNESFFKKDALKALGEIGDSRAVDALLKIYQAKSLMYQGALEELKVEIFKNLTNYPFESAKKLIDLGLSSKNAEIRTLSEKCLKTFRGAEEKKV